MIHAADLRKSRLRAGVDGPPLLASGRAGGGAAGLVASVASDLEAQLEGEEGQGEEKESVCP